MTICRGIEGVPKISVSGLKKVGCCGSWYDISRLLEPPYMRRKSKESTHQNNLLGGLLQ